MMSSMLNSSNLVFATVMVVSSTAVILALLRLNKPDISPPPPQLANGATSRQSGVEILRPCLCSGTGGKKEKKKKKVQFADNVKKKGRDEEDEFEEIMNNMKMEKQKLLINKNNRDRSSSSSSSSKFKKVHCRNSSPNQIPQNRLALYNAILRDRSQRIQFSY